MLKASQPDQANEYDHLIHHQQKLNDHTELQDGVVPIGLLQHNSNTIDNESLSGLFQSPEHCNHSLSTIHFTEIGASTAELRKGPKETADSKQRDGLSAYLKFWVAEWIFSIVSIMILVALVILLYMFDGKPAPNWRFGLTLNTIAAFLSTICRATVMVPVTEALSQLKWNWMSLHIRPLRDLYLFDQASRWPFWSVRLLPRLRGRYDANCTIFKRLISC